MDNDDPPDQMAADYAWSFTTQATADSAPQIIDTIPADGATKVALDATLTITFNEPVTISDEVALECTASGSQSAAVSGGPESFTLTPAQPFEHGESCTVTIRADQVSDLDNDDPPDHMAADTTWSFATAVFTDLLINEVDSDTPESGTDATEFVELYASGTGNIHLGGLVVLFFNGNGDKSYAAFDLNGYRTDANGYFLLGNTAVSGVDLTFGNGILQNGADAVALVEGTASDYPNGTPVTGTIALDALVYDTDDADDPQLLTLLNPGQPQVNENGRGDKDNHSNQRCPNGAGGQRNTAGYKQNSPTPGAANDCLTDAAPAVTATNPDNGATAVPIASSLTITFSEAVNVTPASFSLTCDAGGAQPFDLSGGGAVYTLDPHNDLPPTTSCTVTVLADQVSDVDADDPPDQMTADYSFSFTTAAPADAAPAVALTLPAADATEVALESQIVISFTEPVLAAADAFEVACEASQTADISVRALPPIAPQLYVLTRTPAFDHGERCTVTVRATAVSDLDSDDPPDNLAADYVWSFTTAVFTGLLINEVDADTHGTDTA
ncbi:Ig-like domain-containing protein, partial [Arthrospira platensis SPKY1]|nr:Ig-like domain-containing protein [Arthrospira platensis SPKY1]